MMPKTTPKTDGITNSPSATKRFELPTLNLNFGSLTEGTDIPAPLPSPIQEVPTPPKTPTEEEAKAQKLNGHVNGAGTSPGSDRTSTSAGGLKRPIEEGPASPTASTRGSLRRLLSRSLLNSNYEAQAPTPALNVSRPPSRTASLMVEDRKSKRNSGWFRRLRSTDSSKRNSIQVPVEEPKKGPPPPMIPELSTWERKIDTSIGDDLFKEIK